MVVLLFLLIVLVGFSLAAWLWGVDSRDGGMQGYEWEPRHTWHEN